MSLVCTDKEKHKSKHLGAPPPLYRGIHSNGSVKAIEACTMYCIQSKLNMNIPTCTYPKDMQVGSSACAWAHRGSCHTHSYSHTTRASTYPTTNTCHQPRHPYTTPRIRRHILSPLTPPPPKGSCKFGSHFPSDPPPFIESEGHEAYKEGRGGALRLVPFCHWFAQTKRSIKAIT